MDPLFFPMKDTGISGWFPKQSCFCPDLVPRLSKLSSAFPAVYVVFDKIGCAMPLKYGLKVPIFAPLREGGTVLRNNDTR